MLSCYQQWSNTPLHRAAWLGQVQVAELLVTKGEANLNTRNDVSTCTLCVSIYRIFLHVQVIINLFLNYY